MKQIPFYLFFILLTQAARAQRCEQISMDRFGGDKSEVILNPGILINVDNTFSLTIITSSTSGNILTDCTQAIGGGGVIQTYDEHYTSLISQSCAPVGTDFSGPTFFIFPQSNGDTILIGQSDMDHDDFGIERRDASGNVIWTKHYGGTGSDGFGEAVAATDSGFFLLGASSSHDGDVGLHYGSYLDADIWVLRLDNHGNKLWSSVLGGTNIDIASTIIAASDGGCYVFGVTSSFDHDAIGNHGGDDLYVVKLDSAGQTEWHRCLGGSGSDGTGYENSVRALRDYGSGFYVLARTDSDDDDIQERVPDEYDFWLLHIDSLGNILWENTFGGPGWQIPGALCQSSDGSLWMGGYFLGNTTPGGEIDMTYGGNDGWVVHADSMGHFINQIVLGADKAEYINALHPLPDGTVLACGNYADYATPGSGSPQFPQTTEGEEDIFIARLSPQTEAITEHSIPFDTWELFPNPADKAVTLRIKKDEGKYMLRITDETGKDIYKDRFRRQVKIDTTGWKPGIYIVQLSDRSERKGNKKLIITN